MAAVLHDHTLHWVSVGDSALYLYREGELALLNRAHMYAVDLDAQALAGRITREEALTHPMREALTSYLGQVNLSGVDTNLNPFYVEDDDCILLATDGLSKALAESEIRAAMRGRFQERCEQLVASVLGRNLSGQDNVTVVAIGLQEPLPRSEFPATFVIPKPAPRRRQQRARSSRPNRVRRRRSKPVRGPRQRLLRLPRRGPGGSKRPSPLAWLPWWFCFSLRGVRICSSGPNAPWSRHRQVPAPCPRFGGGAPLRAVTSRAAG